MTETNHGGSAHPNIRVVEESQADSLNPSPIRIKVGCTQKGIDNRSFVAVSIKASMSRRVIGNIS
jgi:hypothetical protein